MNRYWFKPKRWGYGVTPARWEGWTLTATVAAVVVATSLLPHVFGPENPWTWLTVAVVDMTALALLVFASRKKTEGGWHWRLREHSNATNN